MRCRTTGKRTEYRSSEIRRREASLCRGSATKRTEIFLENRADRSTPRPRRALADPVTIIRYLNERRTSGFRSPLSCGLDRLSRSRPHACTLAHTDDGAAVSTRIKTASSVESARHSRESRLRACLPLASNEYKGEKASAAEVRRRKAKDKGETR